MSTGICQASFGCRKRSILFVRYPAATPAPRYPQNHSGGIAATTCPARSLVKSWARTFSRKLTAASPMPQSVPTASPTRIVCALVLCQFIEGQLLCFSARGSIPPPQLSGVGRDWLNELHRMATHPRRPLPTSKQELPQVRWHFPVCPCGAGVVSRHSSWRGLHHHPLSSPWFEWIPSRRSCGSTRQCSQTL